MTRKYTGWDANATGKRAGTEKFVQLLCQHFDGAIWNNGTWVVREVRGGGRPSVHGTGRAADLSWKRKPDGKGFGNYKAATVVLDFLIQHSELLLVEELHDYFLTPHGRGWRCDRAAWKVYDKPTIGSQGGDWWHVEIAPTHADDPAYYEKAFADIKAGRGGQPVATSTSTTQPAMSFPFPGKAVKKGSKGDSVKLVQALVGVAISGTFDASTETAVKEWQTAHKVSPVDGVVGKQTWSVMFGN